MLSIDEKRNVADRVFYTMESFMREEFGYFNKAPSLDLYSTDDECYTDHSSIHIGYRSCEVESEDEFIVWLYFRLGHETQHNLMTTNKGWSMAKRNGFETIVENIAEIVEGKKVRFRRTANQEAFKEYIKKLSEKGVFINENIINQNVHFVANALEDGRIDSKRALKRRSYKESLKVCRGKDWENGGINDEMLDHIDDPVCYLCIIENQILSLATVQKFQKGYLKAVAKRPKINKVMSELKPHIKKAVQSNNCEMAMREAVSICGILSPLIFEACKMSEFEQMLQKVMDKLIQESKNEYTAGTRDEEEGENDPNGDTGLFGMSDLNDEETNEKTEKAAKSKGEDSGSKNEDPNKANDSGGKSDSEKQDSNSDNDSRNTDVDALEDEIASMVKQVIESAVEDIAKNIIPATLDHSDNLNKYTKGSPKAIGSFAQHPDANKVNGKYSSNFNFKETFREYPIINKIPGDIIKKTMILDEKWSRYFQNQKLPMSLNQQDGFICNKQVYKIATGEIDYFAKMLKSDTFSGACYILLDYSGSMSEDDGQLSKLELAIKSLAPIEGVMSKYMALKIVAFDSNSVNHTHHRVIKNFDETFTNNGNGTYSFFNSIKKEHYIQTGGGNKDGYSIRIATQELLERPEKNKLIFVLSDGLPSCYNLMEEGCFDVRDAAEVARSYGIDVVSLYFGFHIEDHKDDITQFQEMYQKSAFVCQPEEIGNKLESVFSTFCSFS